MKYRDIEQRCTVGSSREATRYSYGRKLTSNSRAAQKPSPTPLGPIVDTPRTSCIASYSRRRGSSSEANSIAIRRRNDALRFYIVISFRMLTKRQERFGCTHVA